jgi:hypothetical protein
MRNIVRRQRNSVRGVYVSTTAPRGKWWHDTSCLDRWSACRRRRYFLVSVTENTLNELCIPHKKTRHRNNRDRDRSYCLYVNCIWITASEQKMSTTTGFFRSSLNSESDIFRYSAQRTQKYQTIQVMSLAWTSSWYNYWIFFLHVCTALYHTVTATVLVLWTVDYPRSCRLL